MGAPTPTRWDWLAFGLVALVFVALMWRVPGALQRHSCGADLEACP